MSVPIHSIFWLTEYVVMYIIFEGILTYELNKNTAVGNYIDAFDSSNFTDNIWRGISAPIRQKSVSKVVQNRGPRLEIQPSKDSPGGTFWLEKDCDVKCGSKLFFGGKWCGTCDTTFLKCVHIFYSESLLKNVEFFSSGWQTALFNNSPLRDRIYCLNFRRTTFIGFKVFVLEDTLQ